MGGDLGFLDPIKKIATNAEPVNLTLTSFGEEGLTAPAFTESLIAGRNPFGKEKNTAPAAPEKLPTRNDPEVLAARERLRLSELRRRGRAASNLTGGLGATGVSRPRARDALLFGE